MTTHFGVNLYNKEGGFRLTTENYIKFRSKDFNPPNLDSLKNKYEKALINLDLNMKYFKTLSRDTFNAEIHKIVSSYDFNEITDLNSANKLKGFYIMVLDDYCQAYIGIADDIKRRIKDHWSNQIPLDRLAGGIGVYSLSIDCFRAFDTTRVFVRPSPESDFKNFPLISGNLENEIINKFPIDYCLNQAMAGTREDVIKRLNSRDIRISKVLSQPNHTNC